MKRRNPTEEVAKGLKPLKIPRRARRIRCVPPVRSDEGKPTKTGTGFFSLLLCICLFLLGGCLTADRCEFQLDFETGMVVEVYHDIRSEKEDTANYSAEKDWIALKKMVLQAPEIKCSNEQELIQLDIYEEDGVLSGCIFRRIKCPQCFPSKAALLSVALNKKWRTDIIHGEIFLFLPVGKHVLSSNAQVVRTKNNTVLIWPQDSKRIKFVLREGKGRGESLLPYYLKEKHLFKNDKAK